MLVAVLLGLAAVTTSLAPREGSRSTTGSVPPPSSPQLEPRADRGANVPASEDVPSEPPLMTLDAQRTRQRVEVGAGRRARLAITSQDPGSVQIGTDGPIEPVDPDSPARFDLLYDSPTELAIFVRDAADAAGGPPRVIGRLEVLASG